MRNGFRIFLPLFTLGLLYPIGVQGQTSNIPKTTQFISINCLVRDVNGHQMPVAAYRNIRNHQEVILISRQADHALIVNFGRQKAYKVRKPLLGTTSVNVADERPANTGNVGFMVRRDGKRKEATEIIVYFKDETCFLCGPQTFATIWD
jgi:hypothetical protein